MPLTANFSLRQLRYLVAIADLGSMTAAAEAEHVSPATISMGIHDLERHLGLQLLARRPGHGVSLTEAGSGVLADARRVLSACTDLVSSAKAPGAELRGELNLGCFTTLTPLYVPPLYGTFATEHPAIEVTVVEGAQADLRRALANGSCELAVTYSAGLGDGLATEPIRSMRPYALLPAGHRLAGRSTVSVDDLCEEPLIEYALESVPRGAEQMLRDAGWKPRVVHTSPNIEVVRALVARGLGWTPMFQWWPLNVSLEGLPLAAVPMADVPSLHVVVAWPEQDHLSRRAAAVIAFLRGVARGITTVGR